MRRPGAAHLDHETGGVEQGLGSPPELGVEELPGGRLAYGLEGLALPLTKQLRQDPVHDHPGEADRGLGPEPIDELDGLRYGHLLRGGDHEGPRRNRVGKDIQHPARLLADKADLDKAVYGLRGRQLTDYVAAGDGVDDDKVVMTLPYFPTELAHGDDLANPGRGRGDEVEHLRHRADVRRLWQLQLQG